MRAITFNHDDANDPAKGRVNPEDLSALLSIISPKTAGILNVFENPCSIYQVNYNQSGYATLTLHKGYIFIYGRLIYIEEGEQVRIQLPASGTLYGNFGVKIDLGETGSNEVSWFTKVGTGIQTDNILNNNATGIYEFVLYTYTATTTTVSNLNKTSAIINDIGDYLNGANFKTRPISGDNYNTYIATTGYVQRAVSDKMPRTASFKLPVSIYYDNTEAFANAEFEAVGITVTDYQNRKYFLGNLTFSNKNTKYEPNIKRIRILNKANNVNFSSGGLLQVYVANSTSDAYAISRATPLCKNNYTFAKTISNQLEMVYLAHDSTSNNALTDLYYTFTITNAMMEISND